MPRKLDTRLVARSLTDDRNHLLCAQPTGIGAHSLILYMGDSMKLNARVALASLLTVAVMAFASSSALAATTVNTVGGSYTGRTTSNQTLSAPVGLFTLTISCSQSVTFTTNSGPYTGAGLRVIGSVSAVTFVCGSGATATALNLPWTLGAEVSNFTVAAGNSAGLVTILGIQVEVATALGRCLFRGNLSLRIQGGSAVGTLTGGTLTYVSGPCTGNGTVSSAGYSFSPAINAITGTARWAIKPNRRACVSDSWSSSS